eukprot:6192242-Pleurochrysis_carterae.AAC.1
MQSANDAAISVIAAQREAATYTLPAARKSNTHHKCCPRHDLSAIVDSTNCTPTRDRKKQ